MEDKDDLSQLEELLCADLDDDQEETKKKAPCVQEVNIFEEKNCLENIPESSESLKASVIHNGDTDSSDDEEKRNYTERKYNDYGTEVKKLLDDKEKDQIDKKLNFEVRLRQANIDVKLAAQSSFSKKSLEDNEQKTKYIFGAPVTNSNNNKHKIDVFTDPVFGIRITRPLVSSAALLDRMQGREAVNMLRVKRYVENEDLSKDWVIAGVVVRKSLPKKSQKGSQFLIWTLSDLKDDIKTISMFLFQKAYHELWKTNEGTVVAILNPNVLDRSQNSSDQTCLSVTTPNQVMILGESKDYGTCKSKKKNGEQCTAVVNLAKCEHCIYHVKQEYQKFSKRQELQSSTMGKGLVNLQNKVLGKNTVIYGGKAYSALPKANNKKIKEHDQNRLMSLSDYYKSESESNLMSNKAPYGAGSLKGNTTTLHSPTAQRISDTIRLNKLTQSNSNINSTSGLTLAQKVANSPKLGRGFNLKGNGCIDLSVSYRQKTAEQIKLNAIKLIQRSGGLTKTDPNNIKGTEAGKKRALERLNTSGSDENECKKVKPNEDKNFKPTMSERFKKILEATSVHQNLIQQHEDDEQEKYFSKLEKKEAMEEKMLNTYKLACKAVRCTKCKYTAFSASQLCKDERHPLKVLDTFKRFFKCLDCSNRTISLELLPLHSCGNCGSSRWERAAMMREKKVAHCDSLSIRGEEETFIGGATTGKNINLMVPDS